MKLVHDDDADVALGATVERDIGEDFGGAAEDGSLGVDARVARHHADVFGAEVAAEGEELLVDERLDGARIDGPLPARE